MRRERDEAAGPSVVIDTRQDPRVLPFELVVREHGARLGGRGVIELCEDADDLDAA